MLNPVHFFSRNDWFLLLVVMAFEAFLSTTELSKHGVLVLIAQAVGEWVPIVKGQLTVTSTGVLGDFLAITILLFPLKVLGAFFLVRMASRTDIFSAIVRK